MSTNPDSPNDWRVELMRLTAFPAPGPHTARAEAWWLALCDAPHEKSNRNLKTGVAQLLGKVGDNHMLAIENPMSFELRQLASDPEQPPLDPDALPLFRPSCRPSRTWRFGGSHWRTPHRFVDWRLV